MPADIRSFFGGKSSIPSAKQEQGGYSSGDNAAVGSKRKKARMIIDDSTDDDNPLKVKVATPKKSIPKKAKVQTPKGTEMTSSDYFASNKRSRVHETTPNKTRAQATDLTASLFARNNEDADTNGRDSTGKITMKSYADDDKDSEDTLLADGLDAGDDISPRDAKKRSRRKDDYVRSESDDKSILQPKRRGIRTRPDNDSMITSHKTVDHPSIVTSNKKRKTSESDNDGGTVNLCTSKAKNGSRKTPVKKARAINEDISGTAAVQAVFDSIPTVRAPSPPPKDLNMKYDFRRAGKAMPGANAGPAPLTGTKELPTGAENCLAGLTFVFTGLLETIAREEAQELVKKYGGKVTGQPSSKTSYVVLGSDAGPSKLEKIKKMGIKTIIEDGLFELIRRMPPNGGDSKNAERQWEKKKAEEKKVTRQAEEMEREEKRKFLAADKEARRIAAARGIVPSSPLSARSALTAQLWTTKYAPTQMSQICGNKAQVTKIQKWLQAWPRNHKMSFRIRGADGTGAERAIIIHGPPGIGKTTAAHLAATLEGYDVIESNASDTRSKKLVESVLQDVMNNSSLLGFFAGDGKALDSHKKKIVLIMDEVDGMSAGDRGGVGALAKLCKKTDIPMILICNDRKSQKMKPFDHVAFDIPFRRPTVQEVRSRVATIAAREGLKLSGQVIDALIEGSNKDIRQIINMLSTAKLDQTAMDFDQGKSMSKAWEKHVVLRPWDICHKLLGSGMFASSSKATLNDKIELYFNDHDFSYLMVQENYLSTKPMLANDASSQRGHRLKVLELADNAAESISDGDLVDRMIHGPQQQWGLMPTHAIFSAVRPSSLMSGAMTDRTAFTQWLGNNSKYAKLTRYIKEIQSHMRLRTSGDRHEIRQQYLPILWEKTIRRLEIEGKECVEEVIGLMDGYFLTRDDLDYMLELGIGAQKQENVKLETQTKAAFTRVYNQQSHPLPFMKGSNVAAPQKAPREAPDLEEAIEDEDDGEIVVEKDGEEENDGDLKRDKYIKQAKARKSNIPRKVAGKKGMVSKDMDEDEDEFEEAAKFRVVQEVKARGRGARGVKKVTK
ncbi:MAG: hypothetical protein M1818_005063 [Claussenomyces sp. TS43310]|nr:MAG: hypothetical protein M1818_005063 [Claussenomyces sp. TS43310]